MGGSGQQIVKNTTNLAGWALRSFYDLARITSGQVDPREEPYRAMVLVAPDHIQTGSGRIDQRSTAEQQGAISGKYLVKKGEIIYSKIRPNLQKLALATEDCLCSADMYPVEARENISSVFLKYLMLSTPFTEFATSVSVRSGMPKINREELTYFSALVPEDLKEQEAIAEALSDADALIEGLERLIAKKRLIKQGAMQELLTPERRRLPGFSGEWETKHLGDVALVVMGQSPSSATYNTSGRGLPLIQGAADVTARKTIKRIFTTEITKLGKLGDIILTVRAPVGEVSKAEFDLCLGRGVCAVRTDDEFLYHTLIHGEGAWSALSKGSTFDSVNSEEVRGFEIRYPLDCKERKAIANVLTDMDSEIQAIETRLEKARAIKEGMMQNLLTGRIRLV